MDFLIVGSKFEYMLGRPWSIEPWAKMTAGTGVLLYGHVEGHFGGKDPTPKERMAALRGEKMPKRGGGPVSIDYYRERAYKLYQQGADGVLPWDGFMDQGIITQLGDRDALYEWYHYEHPAFDYSETVTIQE